MTLIEFATSLGWREKNVLPALRALGLAEPCAKCEGTGFYDKFEGIHCFRCVGHGTQLPKLTRALAQDVAARIIRGELTEHFKQRRREAAAREHS